MFDEYQILTTEQFWEAQILEKYRKQAEATNNHIILDKQLRMQAGLETMDWIDSFTKRNEIKKLPETVDGYTIKVLMIRNNWTWKLRKRQRKRIRHYHV